MASEIIHWADYIKQTKKLTIVIDESIGKKGWGKAFKDAIVKFNELSTTTWKLGVTYETAENDKAASVVAYAKDGNFDFEYSDAYYVMKKKTMKFDGESVHGLCSLLHGSVRNRVKRVDETRLVKAFIFVPSKPYTKGAQSRLVGEPVKLVVAVHEMIHAAGGMDDSHHTVDDVFCWPKASFESKDPNDDRVEAFTGQYKEVEIAGSKRRQPVTVAMPPIILNKPTQDKIRGVWAGV
jgi:hypothetical protein